MTNPASPAPRMVRVVRVTTTISEEPADAYLNDDGQPMTEREIAAWESEYGGTDFMRVTNEVIYAEHYTGTAPTRAPLAMLETVRKAVEHGPLSGQDGLAYEPSARLAIATLTNLG